MLQLNDLATQHYLSIVLPVRSFGHIAMRLNIRENCGGFTRSAADTLYTSVPFVLSVLQHRALTQTPYFHLIKSHLQVKMKKENTLLNI